MLRIAFASADQAHVDMHFGGAESLVIFDVEPGRAELVGVARFDRAEQTGSDGRVGLQGTVQDKVLAKLDFVKGCAAVYAASIGSSSIRRLMQAGVQPIIVDNGHEILDLLNEVSLALVHGGLSWVDRAKAQAAVAAPVDSPESGGGGSRDSHQLITSLEDLD